MAQEIATHRGSELALDAPATGLRKWMTLAVSSVLIADTGEFDAKWAKKRLLDLKEDIPTLLRAANSSVAPTQVQWLADRLTVHWKSSTPTSGMEAKSWLHETGRLLKHLPQDILAHAIDEAIRKSPNGFTLTAGPILAEAEPILRERQKLRARLDIIVNGAPDRPKSAWELAREDNFDPANRCKPEEASAIVKEYGFDEPVGRDLELGRDCSNLRQPTKEELAALAAEFKAQNYPSAGPDASSEAA